MLEAKRTDRLINKNINWANMNKFLGKNKDFLKY